MTTDNLEHVTPRLLDWYETQSWAAELESLTPLVLTQLARGEPVDVARIAARTGMTASDVLGLPAAARANCTPPSSRSTTGRTT